MGFAILTSVLVFMLTGIAHLSALSILFRWTSAHAARSNTGLIFALLVVGCMHVIEAGLYAIVFWFGRRLGIGNFASDYEVGAMEIFYFSLVNFTTLGLGDIHPTGHLRLIAGVEALGGFLLIGCSAAFVFAVMRQHLKTTE